MRPPNLTEVGAELAERKLRHFMQQAWHAVEPQPFTPGWHIDAICEHLEAVTYGHIRNLIINVPPRHTKSMTVSVMWPAWEWGPADKPDTRWLFNSYVGRLSIRDSVKCRRLIQSNWYQSLWGQRFTMVSDQNAKERYDNDHGGYRIATSVGGAGTGEGGDRIVVDDPHDINEAGSDVIRQWIIDWWNQVMSTRHNDPRTSSRVIVMQRVHAVDLVGHIKETSGDDYEMLVLPAEHEPQRHCTTSIGFEDPRTKPDELLWKERFGKKEIGESKTLMGSYTYAAQFQQRPSPAEGGIFKRVWWQFYRRRPDLSTLDFIFQSWDMSFKDLKSSSFVVGQIWGVKGADRILLDQIREKLSFTATLKAFVDLTKKWPEAVAKYVEDKANGTAVIDTLKSKIPGIVSVPATESKEARAFAVTPEVEAGNVYLPHPVLCPWVDAYVEELSVFPRGAYSDQVDATTHALMQARKKMKIQQDIAPIVSLTQTSGWGSMSAM